MNEDILDLSLSMSKVARKKWKNRSENCKPKVLLVDDETSIISPLKLIFSNFHWDVEYAFSLEGAFDLLEESKYQLLVLDWHLPDGTGGEIVEQYDIMVQDGNFVPVVFYSSVDLAKLVPPDTDNIVQIDFWKKPMRMSELAKRAAETCRRVE